MQKNAIEELYKVSYNLTLRGKTMLDFVNWCSAKSLPLPEKTTSENTHRSGIRPQYPDAYARSQYPDAYFAPTSATAYLDLKNSKGMKHVKDAGNAPV